MPAPARLYIFYGPDNFSAREAVRALRSKLEVADSNVVRLEGEKASLNEIGAACHTATFFAEPRLVVIEGLAGRFSGRGRGRSRRPARAKSKETVASEMDQLVQIMETLPETTTVVLLDQPAERARAGDAPSYIGALKSMATVTLFGIKDKPEVRRWMDGRFKDRGATIARNAADRLAAMVDGYHLGELAQEIDKLIAFTDGRRIELRDVEELTTEALQRQIWDLIDAVIDGKAEYAFRLMQGMDEKNYPPQMLLSMIVRQHRQVILAQALLKEGATAAQIGDRLHITHPFPRDKVISQASRYPAVRLERAYHRLLEADAAVKTGIMDIDTAIDLLIAELAQIVNAGRRRAPEPARPGRRY